MHYMRWKRWGDPNAHDHRTGKGRTPCSVDDCEKPVASGGLCATHAARVRRASDPKVGPFPRTCGYCGRDFESRYETRATFCSPECKSRGRDPVKGWQAHKKWYLKNRYGISVEDYDARRLAQLSGCAICGRTEPVGRVSQHGDGYWLHVDHDHKTGAIRGLLCGECNTVLGKMNDDPALLRKAADYLAS